MNAPNLLIVDDVRIDQVLAAKICEEALPECRISFASDGSEALDVIAQNNFDLVLTDLQMPGLNGLQLVENLQESRPLVPVVLMTAYGSEELANAALNAGAASYVPKRGISSLLPRTVSRLLSVRDAQQSLRPVRYFSCFISHSHEDHEFCERLCEDLASRQIQVWFAPRDMRSGQPIREQVHNAIYSYDKLLLVLSDFSMKSPWVLNEIFSAVRRETETGSRVFFPVRLVSMDRIRLGVGLYSMQTPVRMWLES